jgi:hypothetical protein
VFSKNTGITYLIQTPKRTTLFVNTTVPKMVNNAMSSYEDTGIIHDVRMVYGDPVGDPKKVFASFNSAMG